MVWSANGPQHSGRRGTWRHGRWVDELVLAPDETRVLPETVPHEWLRSHPLACGCAPCARFPDQRALGRLKARHRGSTPSRVASSL